DRVPGQQRPDGRDPRRTPRRRRIVLRHAWRFTTSGPGTRGASPGSHSGRPAALFLFVVVFAAGPTAFAAAEIELAGEHIVDHLVDGLEVPVAAQLLTLELLEGAINPLIRETSHGRPPFLFDGWRYRHVGSNITYPHMPSNFSPNRGLGGPSRKGG